jgi:hypothetical protein
VAAEVYVGATLLNMYLSRSENESEGKGREGKGRETAGTLQRGGESGELRLLHNSFYSLPLLA